MTYKIQENSGNKNLSVTIPAKLRSLGYGGGDDMILRTDKTDESFITYEKMPPLKETNKNE